MQVDRDAPLRFLKAAFLPDDWIAILLKRHDSGEAVQRVGPVGMVLDVRFQSWLRFKNAHRFDVYVSVNALTPGRRSRTRESVTAVRHLFLDADKDADRVLRAIAQRPDLPAPSFIVRSSRGRAHVLWRVEGMSVERAEALQKHLACELDTDIAATSAAQLTRLPGFLNRKYAPPPIVSVESRGRVEIDGPSCLPSPSSSSAPAPPHLRVARERPEWPRVAMVERARRYVAATPPAVQGRQGDLATFRLCCRLVSRFELSDPQVLDLLRTWNGRCEPPWTERELVAKVNSARRQSL